MPPNTSTGILCEEDTVDQNFISSKEAIVLHKADNRKLEIVWRNVILFAYLHMAALYGVYLFFTSSKWETNLFAFALYVMSGLGITAGAHRLWAHKSYKAKLPLRIILAAFNTLAFQDAVIVWARDHRMHHKYSETDADPHNSTRGFFFSHIGWLMCRKHPEIKAKAHTVDFSDLYGDPVLRFQKKYYLILMILSCFILPTVIPVYCWGETWTNALIVSAITRYTIVLNITWLVNSAAHKFGQKPYDKYIKSVQNITVSTLALGEGFHNYHHTFPWDYKTGELGNYTTNVTKAFIDIMAKIGWAYDLKTASKDIIEKRAKRTGDGTHPIWGWGDKDQPGDEIESFKSK